MKMFFSKENYCGTENYLGHCISFISRIKFDVLVSLLVGLPFFVWSLDGKLLVAHSQWRYIVFLSVREYPMMKIIPPPLPVG